MRKINSNEIEEYSWVSPKGKFAGADKDLSQALGWDPAGDAKARHPFAVEILRLAPGQTPYPYHSHAAQWEFYHVISGRGTARDETGRTPIATGDAFIYVVADNPIGESCYYPDSQKWLVRSPERTLLHGDKTTSYYDWEE